MPGKPEYIYWDTSVFLRYFNKVESQKPTLEAILDYIHANDNLFIATSSITVAEVLYIVESARNAGEIDDDVFDDFWLDRSICRMVDVTPGIAKRARHFRRIFRNQNPVIKLKTPDAIHLATADHLGVNEMHSNDKHHLNREGRFTFRITQPRPIGLGSLFDRNP